MDSQSYATYSFEMPLSEVKYDWRQGARSYFEKLGYRIEFESDTEIILRAGSKLGNIMSFNPKKIKRELIVKQEDNTLFCTLNVSLDFRTDFHEEMEYAQWEIAYFKIFLSQTGDIPQEPSTAKYVFISLLRLVKMLIGAILLVVVITLPCIYIIPEINRLTSGVPIIDLNEVLSIAQRASEGPADVYLMPFYGFPESLAGAIAVKLSEDLKINVRTTTALPIPENSFDQDRHQYDANAFYKPEIDVATTLQDTGSKTAFIGLVRGSIFIKGDPKRFVFACQYDPKFCLIGDSEMLLTARSASLYHTRLYKMVKRQIGKTYYRKPPTSDRNSLMKSPVMSVRDLDKLGIEY